MERLIHTLRTERCSPLLVAWELSVYNNDIHASSLADESQVTDVTNGLNYCELREMR